MTLSRGEVDGSAFAAIADRLADGPDEVHRNQIARLELRKYQGPTSLTGGSAEVLPPDPAPASAGGRCGSHSVAAIRATAKNQSFI